MFKASLDSGRDPTLVDKPNAKSDISPAVAYKLYVQLYVRTTNTSSTGRLSMNLQLY